MKFEHITQSGQLEQYCCGLKGSDFLGFDTEFVSENRYRPELCLIQVASRSGLAIIDALSVKDLTPFWRLIADDVKVSVVHAAREEFLFCFRAIGKRPGKLFDLQMVAGFVGMDYPAAYTTLVQQLLGNSLSKGETRTDWRQRPLSQAQIAYALQDVEFLQAMFEILSQRLIELGRDSWYQEEVEYWLADLEAFETHSQWQRLPGISKLNRRALGIVRQLYDWRDREAKQLDRSPRRVLPDDLLVEIAKRGEGELRSLKDIRGLQQRVNDRYLTPITVQVKQALDLSDKELPQKAPAQPTLSMGLLGQYLATSLNLVCIEMNLAPALVGSVHEVREIAAAKLGLLRGGDSPPAISGWRQQVLGDLIDDVIGGKVALRVAEPHSSQPLKLERWPVQTSD